MARSFASGLVWGLVVVGTGLALISQLAPPPKGVALTPAAEQAPVAGTEPGTKAPVTGQTNETAADAGAKGPSAEVSDAGAAAGSGTAVAKLGETDAASSATGSAAETATSENAAGGSDGADKTADDAAAVPAASAADAVTSGAVADAVKTAPSVEVAPAADTSAAVAATDNPSKALGAAPEGVTTEGAGALGSGKPAPGDGMDLAAGTIDPAQEGKAADPGLPSTTAPPVTSDVVVADQGAGLALSPLPEVSVAPDPLAGTEAPPALSSLDAALTAPATDQAPVTQVPAPDPVGTKDALLAPSQEAGLAEPARLPQIAAAEDPGLAPAPLPVVTAPDLADAAPDAPQALAPRLITPDVPQLPGVKPLDSTLPTVLNPSVAGVETNTLPHIGDAPKVAEAALAPSADQPIVKYARSFENAAGRPLFVILLQDVGSAGMSREDLAKLPFPVTFVVDPLATDAKEAAKVYRDAGQEVLMLANGIPPGATASDLAQSFQTLQDILPEAVGVIDQDTAGFQDNRALSTLVLPVIADQGRGLVTYDRGLNAADQIARRDGLPATVVFRRLDGAGESQPVIRRYLDRAAFKAAQEGSVVVIGDTRADTVASILQWTIEGKASGVALAPVTAVMGRK